MCGTFGVISAKWEGEPGINGTLLDTLFAAEWYVHHYLAAIQINEGIEGLVSPEILPEWAEGRTLRYVLYNICASNIVEDSINAKTNENKLGILKEER